ncbi:hypothetical protein SODALDRAFT_354715 [Sodiomyces alkalinus F11]|uniref:Uncharacterized protein n=1 Tax=Sodiomyces alkalinus (strain CBS 110278 / VKM F-3762 / F11) TaxID=1314773 RepID=A0A3N2Q7B7_SODAK|nr:hypothetical protein SODALDRAFT_354715 [Sodiomyces alkalinus F11]ROT42558.1 hypothetical protein SODALDRAFT_354715 [Sodiomyces alkalinus F11]
MNHIHKPILATEDDGSAACSPLRPNQTPMQLELSDIVEIPISSHLVCNSMKQHKEWPTSRNESNHLPYNHDAVHAITSHKVDCTCNIVGINSGVESKKRQAPNTLCRTTQRSGGPFFESTDHFTPSAAKLRRVALTSSYPCHAPHKHLPTFLDSDFTPNGPSNRSSNQSSGESTHHSRSQAHWLETGPATPFWIEHCTLNAQKNHHIQT